jgi:hypothetical protein
VRPVLSPRAILLSEFWASLALVAFLVWPSVYVLAAAFAFQASALSGTLSRSTRDIPAPEDVVPAEASQERSSNRLPSSIV